MNSLFKKEIKKVRENQSRRPIVLRWAFVNTIFCFVVFTIFSVLIYQITVTTYVNEEKSGIMTAMDNVDDTLNKSDVPLTLQNLHNFIQFNKVTPSHTEDETLKTLNSMVGHRRSFYIYDVDKRLLYTTAKTAMDFQNKPNNKIVEINGKTPGYIVERKIISQETGEPIGYIQAFYDISFYYNINRRLMLTLTILEIVVLILSQIIGFYMVARFMTPLEKLHKAMKKVATSPEIAYQPVIIKTNDEIEDLADVYNQTMEKAHRYLEQQKRLVSDVSHELRTPLAVLDGHINMLNRWGKNDPEILEESLLASREEIIRMKSMLEEMLALSRFENDEMDLEHLSTDLPRIADLTLKNFKLVHENFDLKMINLIQGEGLAKIHENHYEQGLLILLDNAAKYSPGETKEITMTLSEDENYIITSIADKGMGIGEDDIGHVFERFFRADKARSRQIGGTGLGLSIISQLVDNYNGEISVHSKLGIGSDFILKIPKVKPNEE
ncbi:sensor histidine kinase [Lactococcus fujiensis]|uniref:Signal transduction histidine-protein kinase ArlS n=1 Tax=Lactococcus fujiensis JCM 16395 TaxID=1291764 RepID=A0A2A5RQ57_9LACT|nr:ATP-binding protein [Lactococcus fujiensis]PCS01575.1 histidine kinase [Lactococcus fujiensis JCM 16395]